MKDTKSSFKVLNLRHHLGKRLHLGEDVNKWLGVIESCQNLFGQCLLDVINGLFLCLGGTDRGLLSLHLSDCFLKCGNKVGVLG